MIHTLKKMRNIRRRILNIKGYLRKIKAMHINYKRDTYMTKERKQKNL